MTWWFWALLVVVLVGGYLSQVAGRLDRLHIRVDRARTALDEQLLRRSVAVSEVASSGLLDPATSLVLADAALVARSAEPAAHERAESDLTDVLGAVFADPAVLATAQAAEGAAGGGEDLLLELAASSRRVQLAHRFLEDAVRSCARVRGQRLVRWFRLAGRAPWPTGLVIADEPPAGLVAV